MSASFESPLRHMVRKLGYWTTLDEADQAALLALPYKLKTFDALDYMVREGDRPSHSCIVVSGYCFRQKLVADGARQIVSIHMRGDLVDLQNAVLRVADHNVQALVRCEVALVPHEAIRQLAFDRPNVGLAMWYDTLVDGSIFREWIANIGRRDARTRTAHLFCELALRLKVAGLGRQTDYEMPMTQEQLADTLGLTAVHVNRTIKLLESEGLIGRATSRAITIGDGKKLADAGDFDSGYLHLGEDKLALA